MKRTVICNIPIQENIKSVVQISNDSSLPVSDKPFIYPIVSYLSQITKDEDEFKIILLVKKDGEHSYAQYVDIFKSEMESFSDSIGAGTEYVVIDTDYDQNITVHEQLMGKLVDEIETDSHVFVDITYGPKDLPIVVFAALNFAERFLNCEIDNIVYGKAVFRDNKAISSEIFDMIPLYCLSSVTDTIKCDDPLKARQLLKSLLSL